jgi:hypothetical protein
MQYAPTKTPKFYRYPVGVQCLHPQGFVKNDPITIRYRTLSALYVKFCKFPCARTTPTNPTPPIEVLPPPPQIGVMPH